jgi:excinuclease ABC subunit A
MIEHNLDVICQSDYIIDLGPEGGFRGGTVVATGTPEQVSKNKESFTGQFIKDMIK